MHQPKQEQIHNQHRSDASALKNELLDVDKKNHPVEFIVFETADHNAYALVNMRLFDLRIGRVVLIAPQTDGSFRSLQLSTKAQSPGEMDTYIKQLLRSDQ